MRLPDQTAQQFDTPKLNANMIPETQAHVVLPNHPTTPMRLPSNHEELNFMKPENETVPITEA